MEELTLLRQNMFFYLMKHEIENYLLIKSKNLVRKNFKAILHSEK